MIVDQCSTQGTCVPLDHFYILDLYPINVVMQVQIVLKLLLLLNNGGWNIK
jgi:hypothetical protein